MAKKQKAEAAEQGGGAVRARVLSDINLEGRAYRPDAVVELTADQLTAFVALGAVDPHPDAVAYAEQLAAAGQG